MKPAIFSSLLLLLSFTTLKAQNAAVEIRGIVVEENSRQPIEFATVLVGDPATRQPITGATTGPDGAFTVRTAAQDFYVKISFIGMVSRTIEEFQIENGKADLGLILLSENTQSLDEVVVRAERSNTEFALDKRVFNVGKDLSSTGASALEVLNNVPSVNVNIEGEISLRGSGGVQILINGKPSVLASDGGNALGTITADMIERIEVITNPSAKYDAEGTSGIINIVIRKEQKKGLNGSVTLNTGIPNNHSLGLSMNRRTDHFNLFTQVGVGHRTFPRESETINRDLNSLTSVNSIGDSEKNETFYNFILGADYHIDRHNVLSLTGNFALEEEKEFSDIDFSALDSTAATSSRWNREETTSAINPKWQYELQYKRDFADHEDHVLLFSALGHFFGKDQSSDFVNTTILGDRPSGEQETRTDFSNATYRFNLDYTHPFSEVFTLEAGAQYILAASKNDFAVTNLVDGEWIDDPELTNIFDFSQNVLGLYSTAAFENDKWGVKVGLRVENTDQHALLLDTEESNDQNYTNLFPSFHASYEATEALSFQAGYSRRIYRPRMWSLNPFVSIRNDFNRRTGNPDLLPEFTDSYELTGIYILGKASLNLGVYHRYTTDVIERVTSFADQISTSFPLNVGANRTTGLEFNAKYRPASWLTLNADFNYNYFTRRGEFEGDSFDFDADQWSSRLRGNLKLPADLELEVTGRYQSRELTFQSEISEMLFADLGLRKKIIKGKIILNLSVRDLFVSRIRESETIQPDFYLYNRSLRGRFVTFGVSYGFGKGEAMEFSGRKRY